MTKNSSVVGLLILVGCSAGCPASWAQQISFQPIVTYPSPKGPLATVTADFNGDGHLDLAFGGAASGSVSVLLGNGDGTFRAAVNYALPSGCEVNYLAVGDFRKHSRPDLLAACALSTTLVVLPSNADGTFAAPVITVLPAPAFTGQLLQASNLQMAIGDFDQDGILDIIVPLGDLFSGVLPTAYLFHGRGDGTFLQSGRVLPHQFPVSMVAGDFNGDGIPDVAALVLAGDQDITHLSLIIAVGDAQGSFRIVASYPSPVGFGITVGDVNGDGISDLLTFGFTLSTFSSGNPSAGTVVYTGKGDGTFTQAFRTGLSNALVSLGLSLADVRATGKLDLVEALVLGFPAGGFANLTGMISILPSNGDGTFQEPVNTMLSSVLLPFGLAAGDFNGDGKPDLALPAMPSTALNLFSGGIRPGVFAGLPVGNAVVLLNTPVTPLTRVIPQVANGSGFRTTVILINTGAAASDFSLKFWGDDGNPLLLPLEADGTATGLSGNILPGAARFIQTTGVGVDLQKGWAELAAPNTIDGNAIFGLQSPGQADSEAAVPVSITGYTDVFLPFDNTSGYVTGFAFADPAQDATVSASILDDSGHPIPVTQTISFPLRGAYSGLLTNSFPPTQGKRGVAHFSSNTNVFGLGIRSNGKAFTSIEALSNVTADARTIAHIANGSGWKMTLLLVNTDSHAANFTLKFWDDSGNALLLPLGADGNVSSLTAAIQPGELRTVQTTGAGSRLSTGWAELSGTGAIGGTAIFALAVSGQPDSEAAVPFGSTGSTRLFVPYDYTAGHSTGIALANPNQRQATITVSFVDDSGHSLATGKSLIVPAHGHVSIVLSDLLPGLGGSRGAVTLTSDAPIFGLGIRANGLAFTSLKAIAR